jgi:hypothetical protein
MIDNTFAIFDLVYLTVLLNPNKAGAISIMILQHIAPLVLTMIFSILSITGLDKKIEDKEKNNLNADLTKQHLQKMWKEYRETSVTGNGLKK